MNRIFISNIVIITIKALSLQTKTTRADKSANKRDLKPKDLSLKNKKQNEQEY